MTMAVVDSMVFLVAVALLFMAAASQSTGYTNHTVGGPAGWFFNINTQKPSADYSAWAAKQTFNLSDYLKDAMSDQVSLKNHESPNYMNCFAFTVLSNPIGDHGMNSKFYVAMQKSF
ncbi:putative blue copper protein-like isoform 2 [Capsicum annuum]|nr:putative blue copper protein-like isoform 2 [Capsicum annuum]KAF3684475.1 putative blue copper protein-like isoform 2 [Capsicum annuum]